jgi:type III secretion protein U
MAQKNEGGDKTEQPTPKRLRDARKQGDVAKSREVTSTVGVLAWMLVIMAAGAALGQRAPGLLDAALTAVADPSQAEMTRAGWRALGTGTLLVAALALPIAAIALLTDFLQVGPVMAFTKVKPNVDHLNPAEGLKRMFSFDNLVEAAKTLVKTVLLLGIAAAVVAIALRSILALHMQPPGAAGESLARLALLLAGLTVVVFVPVALADSVYQRFSFLKKMRMSRRDIRQEMKDIEGDPYVKGRRQELAREWAQSGAVQRSREAAAVIVNPTHLAVALDYDADAVPVPTVSAKGADDVALAMRKAAEEAGVPVLRDVSLARRLYEQADEGAAVPSELFDAVAQVIVWASEMRGESGERRP